MPSFYIGLDWTVEEDGWALVSSAGFLLFRYLGKKWKRSSIRSFTYLKNCRRVARAPPWPSRQRGASRPSSLCLSLHHLRHHQLQHQLLQQPIQLLHVTAITVVHQQGATLAASASVSPSPPDPGEACAPAGPLPQRRPLHPKSTARPLNHLPSPTPSSHCRQVISVGRKPAKPSFSQLDGSASPSLSTASLSLEEEDAFEDAISTPDTPTPTAASHQPGHWERDLMLHFQDLNNLKF